MVNGMRYCAPRALEKLAVLEPANQFFLIWAEAKFFYSPCKRQKSTDVRSNPGIHEDVRLRIGDFL